MERLVLDPLLRNRVAIAESKSKEGAAPGQDDAPVGDRHLGFGDMIHIARFLDPKAEAAAPSAS
jgi:hypothetical protein